MNKKTIIRKLRIIRIFFAGHYRLAKIIRKRKNREFVESLDFVSIMAIPSYLVKYAEEDFTWWLAESCKQDGKEYIKSAPEPGTPVTIQITKDNYHQ